MKLRILEKKYKRDSMFYVQRLNGEVWEDYPFEGPFNTMEAARSAADRLTSWYKITAPQEIIHDYP